MQGELERFFETWNREAESTLKVLRALPVDQYDFRPDPGGRSLGELAWHIAEGDAYMSLGIERGQFGMDVRPPHIDRPRKVEELAPGFEQVALKRTSAASSPSGPATSFELELILAEISDQVTRVARHENLASP